MIFFLSLKIMIYDLVIGLLKGLLKSTYWSLIKHGWQYQGNVSNGCNNIIGVRENATPTQCGKQNERIKCITMKIHGCVYSRPKNQLHWCNPVTLTYGCLTLFFCSVQMLLPRHMMLPKLIEPLTLIFSRMGSDEFI